MPPFQQHVIAARLMSTAELHEEIVRLTATHRHFEAAEREPSGFARQLREMVCMALRAYEQEWNLRNGWEA